MKQTELEQAIQEDPALEKELAQMAGEVPPVPGDFHQKWTEAIRREARGKGQAPETGSSGRTAAARRWTRAFGAVAVFVFLIGGTMLYRTSRKSLSAFNQQESMPSVYQPGTENEPADMEPFEAEEETEETPAEEAPEVFEMNMYAGSGRQEPERRVYEAEGAMPEIYANAARDGATTAAAYESAADEAAMAVTEEADMEEVAAEKYETEAGRYETPADAAAEGAAMKAAEVPAEMTEAFVEAVEAPVEMKADGPDEPQALPPAETQEQAIPAEKTEEAAGTENTAEPADIWQQAGEFLKDMGGFLLAALPYLLVLAVPAGAALFFRRRKKGRN